MAERYATSSGIWEAARFDGGTLPTPDDTVHANGFAVTISGEITVALLTTTPGAIAVAGGGFTVTGASAVVNADVTAGTSLALTVNSGATFNGHSTGGTVVNILGVRVNNGTHNGDSLGGSATGAHGTHVQDGSKQNGDSYGSPTHGARGTQLLRGGFQTGNSYGGGASHAHGSQVFDGGVQIGDSFGGSTSNATGSLVLQGGIQFGVSTGGSNNDARGTQCQAGGVVVTLGITDATGAGLRLADGGIVILFGETTAEQIDNVATIYTIGNANHPFINEAGGGVSQALLNRVAGLGGLSLRRTA